MMLVHDLFRLSFSNLLLHKVRSVLTSLGVIFGVGSVIAMLAISEGAKRKALSQIEAMGIDNIIVSSKKPPLEGKNEASQSGQGLFDEPYGLNAVDLSNISRMDNVLRVTQVREARKKILRGLTRLDLKLAGVGMNFLEDSGSMLEQGRWFSASDFKNYTKVCVIGKNVKRRMFPLGTTDVIGRHVVVEGDRFLIVGVLDNDRGTQYPEVGNVNDIIYIPMTVSDALYKNYAYLVDGWNVRIQLIEFDVFVVKVRDIAYIDDTSKRISGYLTKTHSATKDWDILVPLDLLKQREATQNIFTIVMSSIAAISLIVGGIGIMNIMLASVFERRKEIGTRRALGAQKSDILLQFLIETVFLTSLGGVLGIIVGVGISQLITIYADMPTVYSWWSIVLSLIISSLVGVVFGTYPAWKAAQQNPITVLRAE
ncbi:ABC transporter permease [Victivallis sp. Marseille-Q1083]|uniref:ABC transporter permease n=1 Tax=Victivallis sp. Marseille-Q1083 TaxID=2717288 RepID=UPI00158D9D99|nr:ABC transporter permease [Victivallis sp. Marseille-Q1083]